MSNAVQWGKGNLFSKWCWNMCHMWQKEPCSFHMLYIPLLHTTYTLYTKINSKPIIDLNVRANTLKFLGENLHYLGFDKDLLNRAQKSMKEKICCINYVLLCHKLSQILVTLGNVHYNHHWSAIWALCFRISQEGKDARRWGSLEAISEDAYHKQQIGLHKN